MMAAFLDALGIKNDEGRIDTETTEVLPQDTLRLAAAADTLAMTYPREEVVVYFLTLLLQDSAIWGGLSGWLEGQK